MDFCGISVLQFVSHHSAVMGFDFIVIAPLLPSHHGFFFVFEKVLIRSFAHFFSHVICFLFFVGFLLLSFATEFHGFLIYLDINPLSDVRFANIFSHSIAAFSFY